MYMMHLYAGMFYIMIYQTAKNVYDNDVCCCSNYSASLDSGDESGFLGLLSIEIHWTTSGDQTVNNEDSM